MLGEDRKKLILIQHEKRFMQSRLKNRKHFVIYQYQCFRNFNIKHLQWSKADLPKEKDKILKKDTLRISVAAIQRYTVKKVSLKHLPPAYWHITKIHGIHHVQNP